jgi:hypothetical protein
MSITAMKQALEALETCVCAMQDYQAGIGIIEMFDKGERIGRGQITALRQAIEQAELVQRAEDAFDRSEQYVMENAQGELERISLVQTGVGIGIQPVAWMYDFLNPDTKDEVIRDWVTQDRAEIDGAKGFNVRPLYATPPQRQPLTDEQISKLWDEHTCPLFGRQGINPTEFARAIEAAHNIKEN